MIITWEAIGPTVAALSALSGVAVFGWRQAVIKGRHEERMESMAKDLAAHDLILAEHTAQLADQAGTFKVISVTLQFLKEIGQQTLDKLERHCEADK